MEKFIALSSVIAPTFYNVHKSLEEGAYTHYWMKGGRGSGKSSFISLEIILGIMQDENANAVVLRKVAANLKNSVFAQMMWAMEILGVTEEWECRTSAMEMTYKKTGQKIIFKGADQPRKIKSTKFTKGYAKYIWYEETDEFHGMDEIRSINQSFMRGGEKFSVFYSYNPPKSLNNWVNCEALEKREDKLLHHSTYLDIPEAWLGRQFLTEAAHMKMKSPKAYCHEYMGEAIGTGGEVFCNLVLREISEEEKKGFDRIARGLDWGYAVDPLHYTVNHYDSRRRRLYIFFEIHKVGASNRLLAEEIKKEYGGRQTVICDSAEPKSIAELREYGIDAIPARKGPDSVAYGMKWLQDLEEIVIDPVRCPHTAREFAGYELDGDGQGGWKARYPDRDNHSIDAVRYSREGDMRPIRIW